LLDDPALKELPDPLGVLGAGATAADAEVEATGTLEMGADDAGTIAGVETAEVVWELWDGTRSSWATTLEADADGEGTTTAATGLLLMRAARGEELVLASVDEVGGRDEETFGSGRDEDRAAMALFSGCIVSAATTLDAGAAVTGTAEDTAGRVVGPVPITSARKAVIHPSNASNSCFNCASAAT